MKIWKKIGLIGAFLGALNFGFNSAKAQTQPKNVRLVDALIHQVDTLNSGIANQVIEWGSYKFKTNSQGYIDFLTGVDDPKDNEGNKDFLNRYVMNNNLVFQYNGFGNLKVYDILGRELFNSENKYNSINFDFSNLSSGMYLYKLSTENGGIKTGAFTTVKGSNAVNFKESSKSFSKNNKSSSRLSKLENIAGNFKIRDEEITSADSVTNLGDYFDIEADYSSLDEIPSVIKMIPVLPFDSPYYRNILHFIKYMTSNDGTGVDTKLGRFGIPIKAFRDSASAPNQTYIAAFDSATSSNHDNSWESMTSFEHKGINLPKMNLFEEVTANPDTGIAMDYTTNFSHVIFNKWDFSNGTPLHAFVYVNNNTNVEPVIILETKHEIGHTLFGSSGHSLDPNHNINGAQYISKDESKSIRIIHSLPNLQNMDIYKED